MKKSIRISLSFANFPDDQFNSFAILVIVCLKTNPLFPALPVALAVLTTLQTAFQQAMNAAAQGGTLETAAKKEARLPLVVALRQIAGYIQSLVPTLTLSQVLSSGYDVMSNNNAQSPLTQPLLTGLDNSISMQLGVSLQPVTNARAYQVQYCIGTAPWLEGGIFPSTKGIIIYDLMPGTTYSVRVRAVGGSTQYSDWSVPMPIMAT
jgi:hypothetical protein